ncbi:hypothetical protein AU255_11125 [Methyloprofundus sedimenti]|uniref:Uncharacterized protein n=1 Tax=Methyloprofundus sedimenti TaxID=1420851 RepID=A0A1V8M9X2_9GAMM|nr:hypothetical protein [Methyloprofundus sedimenti]OQK18337.1 hypothetical protein AU255_11125 [Methyloprofundus sedimenti]
MNFKPLTVSSLLLAGIATSPFALAHGSFDEHYVNVKFELWNSDDVTSLKEIRNEQDVFASDYYYPDELDFFVSTEDVDYFNWNIDFNQQTIELTYFSIELAEIGDSSYQYIYDSPQGFHFQDSEDNLPDIINVTVETSFAPYGLDPKLVTFDKDNIYVNLNGSMCLYIAMPGKPDCTNPDNLTTGYNNQIKLHVDFAYDARTDALFDAIETKYYDLFPGPEESFCILGYYARYYPETGLYMGTLNGHLYGYGGRFGGLLDAGTMDAWYEQLQIPE